MVRARSESMRPPCYRRSAQKVPHPNKPGKTRYEYQYQRMDGDRGQENVSTALERLGKIKVPPTYREVILCPREENEIQGTGRNSTGQLQYFYSPRHVAASTYTKFCHLRSLGERLPAIWKDLDRILTQAPTLPSGKTTGGTQRAALEECLNALAIKIMMLCHFRAGSERYRQRYATYGLCTMNGDHLSFESKGKSADIAFVGKKGQENRCHIDDPSVVRFLQLLTIHRDKLNSDSEQPLLEAGGVKVTPASLNRFLRRYGEGLTTKMWRTWSANVLYLDGVGENGGGDSKTGRKARSDAVIKANAEALHHTAAISKRSYLVKELTDLYVEHPQQWQQLWTTAGGDSDKAFMNFLKTFCKGAALP